MIIEIMPMSYAKAHLGRVERLILTKDLPKPELRKLQAIRNALRNDALSFCVGLSSLIRYIEHLEGLV